MVNPSIAIQRVMIAQGFDFTWDFSPEWNSGTISEGEKFLVELNNKRGRVVNCERRVKVEVLRKRLEKFDEYMAILERAKGYSWEEFQDNPERYGSVERFLQLVIENVSDMASHIIADEGWGKVNYGRDLPHRFFEKGYIDEDLQRRWVRMIGWAPLKTR